MKGTANMCKGIIALDLDGTLLRNDKTISEENLHAIEYFKQEGGLFTFVTGRPPMIVRDIYSRRNKKRSRARKATQAETNK